MLAGWIAGITWALSTVVLGLAMDDPVFALTGGAMVSLISSFLHQVGSAGWIFGYAALRRQLGDAARLLCTRSGWVIVLASVFGGPLGMSTYTASIQFLGPAYTAIITSMFPAVGALLARVFLKDKMTRLQVCGLLVSIGGVILLSYTPGSAAGSNPVLGFACAAGCCLSWALEAVICAWGLRHSTVPIPDDQAMVLRQGTSVILYAVFVVTPLGGWGFAAQVTATASFWVIAASALFGMLSCLFYYKSIAQIGPAKAMVLDTTYSVWSIPLSALFLGLLPDPFTVVCCLIILAGSLTASTDLRQLLPHKK